MFSNGSLSVSSQSQAAGRTGRWRVLSPASPALFIHEPVGQCRARPGAHAAIFRAGPFAHGRRAVGAGDRTSNSCIIRDTARHVIVSGAHKPHLMPCPSHHKTQGITDLNEHANRSFPWTKETMKGIAACAEKLSIGSVK